MAKKTDLRHADDWRCRVSSYFETGQRLGDLEIVNNIERCPPGDNYRIQVRCMACNGPVYWCRVSSLRSGQCHRCVDCRRHQPVFVMDCDGHVHNIAGASLKDHELNAIYKRCKCAQQRCSNSQNPSYFRYGGRGIRFRFKSPMMMLAYVIGLPGFTQVTENELTIDRIDNNGDYAVGNLRWASRKIQTANRRDTCYVDLGNGQRVTRPQAVNVIHHLTGRPRNLLNHDFERGKSFAEALEFAQRATGERVDEHEQ